MNTQDNKRIAKNTLFLYIRMFLTILVNLYTVKIVWNVLGVSNYGIYNVVGGIVALFAFLKTAMIATSQRFTSFELGRGGTENLSRVFNVSIRVHFILAIAILLLAETAGIWFLNFKLNIPVDRNIAANWVYQCSVLTLLVGIISIPFDACIIAHEHMKIYGYLGIIEVVLRLIMVVMLIWIPGDKLIIYGVMMLIIGIIMRLISQTYCRKHFIECRYRHISDKGLIKRMFSFSSWSFIGNLGFTIRDQGLNFIINICFNVAINAAKGISNQISAVVNGLAYNFQLALNPQITKKYAAGNEQEMMQLIFVGCKFSAFLIMFIVVPLIFASNLFLTLWIDKVAPYTTDFLQLILINTFIDSMVGPITAGLQATGKIKKFQLSIFALLLLNLPVAWIWLKLDANPLIVSFITIITSVIALGWRLHLLHELVTYSYKDFVTRVITRVGGVLCIAILPIWYIFKFIPNSIIGLISYCIATTIILLIIMYTVGLTNSEKTLVSNIVKRRLHIR